MIKNIIKTKKLQIYIFLLIYVNFTNNIKAMDQNKFVSVLDNKKIIFWDLNDPKNPKKVNSLKTKTEPSKSVSFSFCNKNIFACVSAHEDIEIYNLYKPTGKECVAIIQGANTRAGSIEFGIFNGDKNFISCACSDSKIKFFDLSDANKPKLISEIIGAHQDFVSCLSISHLEAKLASGSRDAIVKIWDISDLKNPKLIKALTGHTGLISSLQFSYFSKNIIASASIDGEIKIWDLSLENGKELLINLPKENNPIFSIKFNRFNKKLACTTGNHIKIWDLSNLQNPILIKTLKNHKKPIHTIDFSNTDQNILVSGSWDNTINIWDLSQENGQELLKTLDSHEDKIKTVKFIPVIKTQQEKDFKKSIAKKQPKKQPFSDTIIRTLH